ncbi:hypothetical protein GPA10_12450 [Streptomyces sp. p1417]|uniref:Novel STAND NTPase 1 domain-containing protein n=1 Tax=Streptomyces typhae TaxID=2681492 RepID=A0A6L6WXA3_9ACTN|nr:hypothetical protein [Streptomyces typhae]
MIAVRADFYGHCAEHRALADALTAATLLVGPMNPAELRAAIIKPAQAAGLIVERDLTAQLISESKDEPGGLPLLSHVLLETWRRSRGRALTKKAYEAAGGLHGAIAQTAETLYTQLTAAQADLARTLLLRLISPGDGSQDTRRPVLRSELDLVEGSDEVGQVTDRLVRARLITMDEDTVELAHEALISGWPRLHACTPGRPSGRGTSAQGMEGVPARHALPFHMLKGWPAPASRVGYGDPVEREPYASPAGQRGMGDAGEGELVPGPLGRETPA